jgi:hypothetical protein
LKSLVACEFFTKPVYTLRGKFDAYVLVFLHLGSRRVTMSQPTFHPDEAWVLQQARNVTTWLDDHGIEARYLIRDLRTVEVGKLAFEVAPGRFLLARFFHKSLYLPLVARKAESSARCR